jgi:hypothetical protein
VDDDLTNTKPAAKLHDKHAETPAPLQELQLSSHLKHEVPLWN